MKRVEKRKLKICVLNKIKLSKGILFGQFSLSLSKNEKKEEWESICSYAKSIGALDSNKDWTYLRDVWWPNAKKATAEKVDNSKKTGTGGGKDVMLDDADEMIVDIIGRDSPVIDGLNVIESTMIKSPESSQSFSEIAGNECYTDIVTLEDNNGEALVGQTHIKGGRVSKKKAEDIKKQRDIKMELQIQLLKAEIYHRQLECRKLELELGLEKSETTQGINEAIVYSFES